MRLGRISVCVLPQTISVALGLAVIDKCWLEGCTRGHLVISVVLVSTCCLTERLLSSLVDAVPLVVVFAIFLYSLLEVFGRGHDKQELLVFEEGTACSFGRLGMG
jgi:hypothetical protein